MYIVLFIVFALVTWIFAVYFINKAKRNIKTRNNILSCLYFFMDMGPNVSSVSIVAVVIVPKDVTNMQLIIIFILGIMMKKIGRIFKSLFYQKLEIKDKKDQSC